MRTLRLSTATLAVTFVGVLSACTPQSAGPVSAPTAASVSSPGGGSQMTVGSGQMSGMGHGGMDMNAMMAHCEEMRQQAKTGSIPPSMQQMMAQCAQMDHSMHMGASHTR